MRISRITANGVKPVENFFVEGISDLMVIAGPNGVGKSRLIDAILAHFRNPNHTAVSLQLESTNSAEKTHWEQSSLDTSIAVDKQKLIGTLQKNKLRRNFQSSVIYFESGRSITNVSKMGYEFEYADPYTEELKWDFSFQGVSTRWQDTIHAIFKKLQMQKTNIANRAIQLRKEGRTEMNLNFEDPLDPFREVFENLLGPKKLNGANIQSQTLEYIEDGEVRNINSLSSGEREVLNIAFDFLLRRPSDCVVFFDEPELHLHPELLLRLIATLRTIGANNQFILISHSPDLISSSINDTVVFLQPSKPDGSNQALILTEQGGERDALNQLGQSIGVISLGRKIVLIEGKSSSLDKQTYTQIVGSRFPNLVLVPSGGKDSISNFEKLNSSVLENSLWGIDFFMVADRDAAIGKDDPITTEKFKILSKYHLENYFLDSEVLAQCFAAMEPEESWLRSTSEIEDKLTEIATEFIGYATMLSVSARTRLQFGNLDLMTSALDGKGLTELSSSLEARLEGEIQRFTSSTDRDHVLGILETTYKDFQDSLENGSWRVNFPGRPILNTFCGKANMRVGRVKSLYLALADKAENDPFEELIQIFEGISDY